MHFNVNALNTFDTYEKDLYDFQKSKNKVVINQTQYFQIILIPGVVLTFVQFAYDLGYSDQIRRLQRYLFFSKSIN